MTNPRYITTKTLEPYFVNKDSGLPLIAGTIEFYKDDDRLVPKAVYQLSGAPPNYTFDALPNPLTLSGVGTIQNAGGDNVALYYLPYESDTSDTVELYYVVVKDSTGVVQFTREGWPDIDEGSTPGDVSDGTIINEISNSQFVDLYFTGTLTIAYTGNTTTTMPLGPDWDLVITHSDAGSITVVRNAIAGSSNTETNPPYTLTVTCGANVTSLKLRQRFTGNPDIWVPTTANVAGFVNGGVLLGANTSVVMRYEPSTGTDQVILNTANAGGTIAYKSATVQLTIGDNAQVGGVGYVDITLQLSNTNGVASTLSSVQLVGLVRNQTTVAYKQDSINLQRSRYSNVVNATGFISGHNTGRLTLTSGTPITTNDVTGATTIYYTPYKGNTVWLYINSVWVAFEYAEISIAVPAVANQMYDVFVSVGTGTTPVLSVLAWASDTARATALTTQDGVYVLTGATGTRYLGSFRTRTAGQVSDSAAFRHLYNYYNRVNKNLNVTDNTASWVYTNPVFQQANNSTANQVEIVQGVLEDCVEITLDAGWNNSVAGGGTGVASGIGVDNLTPVNRNRQQSANANQIGENIVTFFEFPPTVGRHFYTWLEASDAAGVTTWYGTFYSDNFGLTGSCWV